MRISMPWRNSANARLRAVLVLLAALTAGVQAFPQQLISFDAPHAGNVSGTGTEPAAINAFGGVTGIVVDNSFAYHGFVRMPWGEAASFDAPGADPLTGCTCPTAINDFGAIVGYTIDAKDIVHGFLRTPGGAFSIFNVPGAPRFVIADSINDFGVTTGHYFDAIGVLHGFVRRWDGKITEFEESGAGQGVSQGTFPDAVNTFDLISGLFIDAENRTHGFLRAPSGASINFDVPGTAGGMVNAYVNDVGLVAGTYAAQQGADQEVEAGFQRLPDGTFTVYSAPSGSLENLEVNAVNVKGTATGFYENASSGLGQAFVRYTSGPLITLRFPATATESVGEGINARGVATGWWSDATPVYHGYLWLPK